MCKCKQTLSKLAVSISLNLNPSPTACKTNWSTTKQTLCLHWFASQCWNSSSRFNQSIKIANRATTPPKIPQQSQVNVLKCELHRSQTPWICCCRLLWPFFPQHTSNHGGWIRRFNHNSLIFVLFILSIRRCFSVPSPEGFAQKSTHSSFKPHLFSNSVMFVCCGQSAANMYMRNG